MAFDSRAFVLTVLLLNLLAPRSLRAAPSLNTNEDEAKAFLAKYNEEEALMSNMVTKAAWNYNTNITDENEKAYSEIGRLQSEFSAQAQIEAAKFDPTNFSVDTRRQLKEVGSKPLPKEEELELGEIIAEMGKIYGATKVCLDSKKEQEDKECLNLTPGLGKIMKESTDYTELNNVWKEWRTQVGRPLKPLYERYVELKNKRSRLNGYTDLGDDWRSRYETDTFEEDMKRLYVDLEPLYKELHAYVRRKLHDLHGEDAIDLTGPLPASVLGDMWGRFWNNLYQHMIPYPDKPSIDPSEELRAQNYTVEKLFRTGDDFYAAMGLKRVPESFWKLSMMRKPDDGREVICHATAWDFFDGKDFRIKMCAEDYSFEDLNTIHHELGHTQYQAQYAHLPTVYRDGANDGFHEAIGELMAMAGATPKHLFTIGLMKELVEDDRLDVNFLLSQSLITVSTLPFHLVNDLWRWKIFRGDVKVDKWNEEFWRMKEEIVGVKAPVEREQEDLDPPTLFHINQDFDMIRYFTRTVLQFQFWERLCEISGHTGPLHRCDFSGSTEAGEALAKMLRLGSSRPWQDALEQLTGTRQMSTRPIVQFFQPLHDWLKKVNKENGDVPGW